MKNLIFFSLIAMLTLGSIAQEQDDDHQIVLPKDTLPEKKVGDPLPTGLKVEPLIPKGNEQSNEKIALGRKLFFDSILSEDDTVSCASCHQPEHGFASPDTIAVGIGGNVGTRNAPSLLNKAYTDDLFWDGRASTLEEQAIKPLSNPNELGSDIKIILEKLRKNEEYVGLFGEVFEGDKPEELITETTLGQAIASFERTLLLGNTQVDRFHAAEYGALNEAARQGMWIFESRGKCWKCHNGETFSDNDFHNTGVSFGIEDRDTGRFQHTGNDTDKFKFRTPSLRGIEHTAPYMHDGSVKTLREVVEFYNKGGSPDDPVLSKDIVPLNLTEKDIDNLVEFLKALSN